MRTGPSTPLEPTCRLPARRPVPNYYSCLQTFISRDGPQNPAAYEMSKQRLQQQQHTAVDMNLFMLKRTHPRNGSHVSPPPLCLPREQTFMKTFPQNHYNSITIPSSRYLRHDCICCSANPPTQTPQHLQRCHHHHFLYTADVTKQGGRARRLHFLWDVCGEALSSSTFYTCSSHSQCVSIHHPLWGERERGSSRQTCSYATAICRGKRMNC